MNANTVYVKRCETYDKDAIELIVKEGMVRLNYQPEGNVFVKPNVVFAYKPETFGDMAFTTTSFVGASLSAISSIPSVKGVDMGENSAIGFPTRLCYKSAGYYEELKRVRQSAPCPVNIFCMDEELRTSVFIGGNVHDRLRISTKMAKADAKVYLPKLKCHCVSKMTGAVKLNIGICSDDERSIRHDFMLNEKIVDLLSAGYPDFIIMDAIDVGVGNEAFPVRRKLGLILMGTNPLAVDIIGCRLLGLDFNEVPYLKRAKERGYTPATIDDISLRGDLTSLEDIDEQAKRLHPYDDAFYGWQDIHKELKRLNSPIRFEWGGYKKESEERCLTGCVMGVKMFLGGMEKFAGSGAFADARPAVFVIGKPENPIDAQGEEVYLIGSCAEADISNARKVIHMDRCFTTASDMNLTLGHRLGMPAVTRDAGFFADFAGSVGRSSFRKMTSLRYAQDISNFVTQSLIRRI